MRAGRALGIVAACSALLAPATAAVAASGGKPVVVAHVSDPRIDEASALVVSSTHPGVAWTVNDSGSGPDVYGISTRTGRTVAVLRMRDVDARDMEAMASGVDGGGHAWLWVGDIGDNSAQRSSVVLRAFREPTSVRSQTLAVQSLRLRYPDGPADAETLVWTSDRRLLVVTKALLTARVYEVPPVAVAATLAGHPPSGAVLVRSLGTVQQTLATDGAPLPDGRVIVRGYESATVYGWSQGRLKSVGALPLPQQRQGESIAVERDGRSVLVGSEGVDQPLYRLPLAGVEPLESLDDPSTPAPTSSAAATARHPSSLADDSPLPRGLGYAAAAVALVLLAAVAWLAGGRFRGGRPRSRRTR